MSICGQEGLRSTFSSTKTAKTSRMVWCSTRRWKTPMVNLAERKICPWPKGNLLLSNILSRLHYWCQMWGCAKGCLSKSIISKYCNASRLRPSTSKVSTKWKSKEIAEGPATPWTSRGAANYGVASFATSSAKMGNSFTGSRRTTESWLPFHKVQELHWWRVTCAPSQLCVKRHTPRKSGISY